MMIFTVHRHRKPKQQPTRTWTSSPYRNLIGWFFIRIFFCSSTLTQIFTYSHCVPMRRTWYVWRCGLDNSGRRAPHTKSFTYRTRWALRLPYTQTPFALFSFSLLIVLLDRIHQEIYATSWECWINWMSLTKSALNTCDRCGWVVRWTHENLVSKGKKVELRRVVDGYARKKYKQHL